MNGKQNEKPYQIIDYSDLFEIHPSSDFIGRKRIFQEIDEFLSQDNQESNILFLHGESGIGKTSLLVNYLRANIENEPIYYFVDYNEPESTEALRFLKHMYHSLMWNFNRDPIKEELKESDLSNLINREMDSISKNGLQGNKTQAIFIDALDEVIQEKMSYGTKPITDSLPSIKLPKNFKIVITSTRTLSNHVIKNPKNIKTISMFGDEEENILDIRRYFAKNLPPRDKVHIEKIVANSQGNFQYSIQFVKMIENGEINLSKPPEGLNGIYDLKLKIIREKVEADTFETILKIIILTTIIYRPPTIELLCSILDINYHLKNKYLFHVEQFFSITQRGLEQNKCKWFHHSFYTFIEDEIRFPKKIKEKCYNQIIKYIKTKTSLGLVNTMPHELVWGMPGYFYNSSYKNEFFSFIRKKFLPQYWNHVTFDSLWFVRDTIGDCEITAEFQLDPNNRKSCEDFAFFRLLNCVVNRYHNDEIQNLDKMDYQEIDCEELKRVKYKGYTDKKIRALLNEKMSFTKDISSEIIDRVIEILNTFYKEFDNISNILTICEEYIYNWFPTEETQFIETPVQASVASTQKNNDPKEIIIKDYVILENSSIPIEKTLEEIEVIQSKRDKLSINIYIDDTQGVNFYKSLDKVKKKQIRAGKTYIYYTFLLLFLNIGKKSNYTELSIALSYLIKGKEVTLGEFQLHQTKLKDLRDTQFSTINKNISRIKNDMAKIFGNEITNSFINSESREVIYIRSCQETSLQTLVIMRKSNYDKYVKALEFGKSIYRNSF